ARPLAGGAALRRGGAALLGEGRPRPVRGAGRGGRSEGPRPEPDGSRRRHGGRFGAVIFLPFSPCFAGESGQELAPRPGGNKHPGRHPQCESVRASPRPAWSSPPPSG